MHITVSLMTLCRTEYHLHFFNGLLVCNITFNSGMRRIKNFSPFIFSNKLGLECYFSLGISIHFYLWPVFNVNFFAKNIWLFFFPNHLVMTSNMYNINIFIILTTKYVIFTSPCTSEDLQKEKNMFYT